MLKLEVKSARARVRARYFGSGSIKAETVETGCEAIETELLLESDEAPEKSEGAIDRSQATLAADLETKTRLPAVREP